MKTMNRNIFCALSLLIFIGLMASSASAATSWQNISVSGSAQNNYQINITIPYKAGMSADFSNIRFFANNTMENGGTSLPYLIESQNDSSNVSVLVPLPLGCTKIVCEWGIDGQTVSQSNATAVLDIYDDFNGTTLDPSWTYDKDPVTNSYLVSSGAITFTFASNSYAHIQKAGVPNNFVAITKMKRVTSAGDASWAAGMDIWFNADDHLQNSMPGSYKYWATYTVNNAAGITATTDSWTAGTYTYLKTVVTNTNYYVYYSPNGITWTQIYTAARPASWTIDANSLLILGSGVEQTGFSNNNHLNNKYSSTGSNVDGTYDWVRVQKYNATPPTVTLDEMGTPITPAFTANVTSGYYNFTVQFTDQSNVADATAYSWDFGDGSTDTIQNPIHTYTRAGVFSVSESVTNVSGAGTTTKNAYITSITPACTILTYDADNINTNLTNGTVINFNETSVNAATTGWYVNSVPMQWNNTTQLSNFTWVANTTGTKNITCIVNNANNTASYTWNYTVYNTVVTAFSANTTSGSVPLTLLFTDNSPNATSYDWDFGDGTTGSGKTIVHTYTIGNMPFTVSLNASNPISSSIMTKTNYITTYDPIPVANFTSNITADNSPVNVQFNDTSTGELNVTGFNWSFGDNTYSTLQNPTHTYTVTGAYTVSLNVTNNGGSNVKTISNYIVVYDPPCSISATATNNSNVAITQGTVIKFNSTVVNSRNVSWLVNGVSQQTNNTAGLSSKIFNYTYTANTVGAINLTVLISNNWNPANYTWNFTVYPQTASNFNSNVTTVTIPAGVQFNDTSTGSPTAWLWNFGDNTTSTDQNPIHAYTVAGRYSVSLNVSNPANYNNKSVSNYVLVHNAIPVANITVNDIQGSLNVTAPLIAYCTDTSTGINITQWAWDFNDTMGGLGTATTQDATHVYPLAGNYSLTLTVTNDGGSNTTIFPIEVTGGGDNTPQKPIAGFSSNASTGYIPLTVQFINVSAFSPRSFYWDFGDDTNSTVKDPIHTYSDRGVYNVSLRATNDYGSDTIYRTDYIHTFYAVPITNFVVDIASGESPLNVQFTDTSTGIISAYNWSFGDDTYSTEQNPTHEYTQSGMYNVSLCASNMDNSYTVTRVNCIIVDVPVPAPIANFTSNVTSGFAPSTIEFTDISANAPSNWTWNFGDGIGSYVQSPTHVYNTSGTYTVALTARNIGGSDVVVRSNYITITDVAIEPIANFYSNATFGIAPFGAQFMDISQNNPTSWLWDFGDNTTSTEQNPLHVYTTNGRYNVSLTVNNSVGSNTKLVSEYITVGMISNGEQIVADFTSNITTGVAPVAIAFTDTSTNSPNNWTWNFGDGIGSYTQNPTHIYSTPGTYTVILLARNNDTSNISVKFNYVTITNTQAEPITPVANFYSNTTFGVSPFNVQFVDISQNNPTTWLWNFGDNTTSTEQSPIHSYTVNGLYNVSLTANNSAGNNTKFVLGYITAGTIGTPGNVMPTVAAFTANQTIGVVPLVVNFTDQSTNTPTSWLWDFGDNVTSPEQNPQHQYNITGNYTVSLMINGNNSLVESKITYIKALQNAPSAPIAQFYANNTTFASPYEDFVPIAVQFTDTSVCNPMATSWQWTFGDGTGSNEQNPIHIYNNSGYYTVSLTVNNDIGVATATMLNYISIVQSPPAVAFVSSTSTGYIPLSVQFTNNTTGYNGSFYWDFGDGASSTEAAPYHEYINDGIYTVTLTLPFNGQNYSASQVITANYVTRGQLKLVATQPDQLSNVSATNLSIIRMNQTSKQAALYHEIKAVTGGTNDGYMFLAICILIGGLALVLGVL